MNRLMPLILAALFATPLAAASESKPVFHPLWVPPGKNSQDLKPRTEARAEEPIVLELRAHRHADGSLHFECDHAPAAPRQVSTQDPQP